MKQILRWLFRWRREHQLAQKSHQQTLHSLKNRQQNRQQNRQCDGLRSRGPISKRSAHDFAAKSQDMPAAMVPDDSSKIIYAVPRAEAVAALNQSLHQSLPQLLSPVSTASAFPKVSVAQPRPVKRPAKPALKPINPAAPIAIEAIEAIEPDSGNHLLIAPGAMVDAAYLCECQGRYAEAERLYQRALTAIRRQLSLSPLVSGFLDKEVSGLEREAALEDRYAALISGLEDLAGLYYRLRRYQNVLPLLEESLAIRQDRQITHSADLGEKIYQLADAYRHQAMYGKAESMFQRSLDLLRQQMGPQHPRTQAVYSEFMQMIATVIESGQFDQLGSALSPLDLDHLSDRYSWAKPTWQQP